MSHTEWEPPNLLLQQESPRKRGSGSATSSEQDSPNSWPWLTLDLFQTIKRMSETYEPQGQIYRQKENSLIFFRVFIVTVKIGLSHSGDTFIAHLSSHVLRHMESQQKQARPGTQGRLLLVWKTFCPLGSLGEGRELYLHWCGSVRCQR